MYDVLIIGAGPSGSTLAFTLARAGVRVALVEKAPSFRRSKPCGGGLDSVFFRSLPPTMWDPALVEERITQLVVTDGRKERTYALKGSLVMTSRESLDGHLAEMAAEAGASVFRGWEARGLERVKGGYRVYRQDGQWLGCGILVGADGAYSLVGRMLGLGRPRVVYVGTDWAVDVPSQILENFRGRMCLDLLPLPDVGYSWVFPKANHLSVGVGAPYRAANRIKGMTERSLGVRGLNGFPTHRSAHWIPFARPGAQFVRGHALVVGDAAGLVDPGSGGGIGWGVLSAALAAEAISGYLERGNRLDSYQSAVEARVLREFRASEALRNNILLQLALGRGATNGWWQEALRVIAGGETYQAVMKEHRMGYNLGRLLQSAVWFLIERRNGA